MDLYGILGVSRNADAKAIHKAYRAKAKASHPDTAGGSEESFHAVALAYRVLSDPDARARYDETGEIKPQGADNNRARALSHIDKAMVVLMMSDADLYGSEVIRALQDHLTREMDVFDGAVTKLTRAKERLLVLREHLRPTNEEERSLEGLMAQQLREVEGEIEIKSAEIRSRLMACEILERYEFEFPEESQKGRKAESQKAEGFVEGLGGVFTGARRRC